MQAYEFCNQKLKWRNSYSTCLSWHVTHLIPPFSLIFLTLKLRCPPEKKASPWTGLDLNVILSPYFSANLSRMKRDSCRWSPTATPGQAEIRTHCLNISCKNKTLKRKRRRFYIQNNKRNDNACYFRVIFFYPDKPSMVFGSLSTTLTLFQNWYLIWLANTYSRINR